LRLPDGLDNRESALETVENDGRYRQSIESAVGDAGARAGGRDGRCR
jgi:hypothetical protein